MSRVIDALAKRDQIKKAATEAIEANKKLAEDDKKKADADKKAADQHKTQASTDTGLAKVLTSLEQTLAKMLATTPEPVAAVAPADNTELQALRDEMATLRKVLDHQSKLIQSMMNVPTRYEIVRDDETQEITAVVPHRVRANA